MKLQSITENQKGFVKNIEKLSTDNCKFRKVLYTAKNTQLVVMSLKPGESIGAEKHSVDQFFRVEEGIGEVIINGDRKKIGPGSGIIIPANAKHNITNTGEELLQLYTLYSPPHHKEGTIHSTKQDAKSDDEHFDGETTE
jgi:mannose-6-phosphate isomerase-like protein (cupin superfamily)